MNTSPNEAAQRLLDRLPRPPYELPDGDPMRALADIIGENAQIEMRLGELEDEADELGRRNEDLADADRSLSDLEATVREWRSDLAIALQSAEDGTLSADERLASLIASCEDLHRGMEEVV